MSTVSNSFGEFRARVAEASARRESSFSLLKILRAVPGEIVPEERWEKWYPYLEAHLGDLPYVRFQTPHKVGGAFARKDVWVDSTATRSVLKAALELTDDQLRGDIEFVDFHEQLIPTGWDASYRVNYTLMGYQEGDGWWYIQGFKELWSALSSGQRNQTPYPLPYVRGLLPHRYADAQAVSTWLKTLMGKGGWKGDHFIDTIPVAAIDYTRWRLRDRGFT